MSKLFDRMQSDLRVWVVCLSVMVVGLVGGSSAVPAFDQISGDLAQSDGSGSGLKQDIAMVLPFNPSDMTPQPPVRKPEGKPAIIKTSTRAGVVPVNPNLPTSAMTSWDRGLSAWVKKDYTVALTSFAVTATAKKSDDWMRAAGAFWAARAAEQLGDSQQAYSFRTVAATYQHTFYGQLALAQLGRSPKFNWDVPAFDEQMRARLVRAGAAQVFDMVDNGRLSAADQALIKLMDGADRDLRHAAVVYAMNKGLPAAALRLAPRVAYETGIRYDAAYYPQGSWVEADEYRVERALVHAIIRQESKFDPRAKSGMGAVGLMQLLPSTAQYVIKVRAGSADPVDLSHSLENLNVGQHYIEYLLDHNVVGQDLLNLLMAYNAGPGNLAKWQKKFDGMDDPLLFIESIPSAETRKYVERVAASYWIYRDRMGLANPTLSQIAAGEGANMTSPARWASTKIYLSSIFP